MPAIVFVALIVAALWVIIHDKKKTEITKPPKLGPPPVWTLPCQPPTVIPTAVATEPPKVVVEESPALKLAKEILSGAGQQRDRTIDKMEVLPHILLWGPPGTGKTTLARIIAKSLGETYGFEPALLEFISMQLQDTKDIRRLGFRISRGSIVFIDEVHGLPKEVAEMLYPALQDGILTSKSGSIFPLPSFTAIGATTEPGSLPEPFRDRFPMEIELKPLTDTEVHQIVSDFKRGIKFPETFELYHGQDEAKTLLWMHIHAIGKEPFKFSEELEMDIAKRAAGIPRIAKNITWHMMAVSKALGREPTEEDAKLCFELLGIDANGLHRADRRAMKTLFQRNNKPMGAAALASAAGIGKTELETMIEGRLVRLGYMERTPRGRALTPKGIEEYEFLKG
jgi:holliday junction DNA helicase RuvB